MSSSPSLAEAIRLLDALAGGRHPVTGNPLEAPDWLLDPPLQAALQVVLEHARNTGGLDAPSRPSRQGKPWPHAEEVDLLDAWETGHDIAHIATQHQRSTGAIRARLVRMGVEVETGEPADRRFLQAFQTLALVSQGWHHTALLRVVWTLLLDHTVQETTDQLRVGLQALARHFHEPADAGYHETLTVAWVRVIAGRIRSVGREAHFHRFIEQHPDLLDPSYLRRHYSHARAMSADARTYFLPADREPLPSGSDRPT